MPGRVVSADAMLVFELATENAELRFQLAEAQDQCVEMAVDAGELHAEIEALRAQLALIERDRDAWRDEAERVRGWRSSGAETPPPTAHAAE